MRRNLSCVLAVTCALFAAGGRAPAHARTEPLVVLTPTGAMRDGLPVLTRHPHPQPALDVLTRGFSGRLLRLYALEQEFLRRRTGRPVEPAYLLLSERQGGFPQFGFYLDDVKKADAGWVDLHRRSALAGRFGAMDQIFPHELLHVIVHQLSGPLKKGGANQIHAIGVRTDQYVAFSEGFAEHAQVMAVDDEDAVSETKALPGQPRLLETARANLAAFDRDLRSRSPFPASRLRFLLWFTATEQALRYHAVRENWFSREPAIPDVLLGRADRYEAYLYANVMPGREADPRRASRASLSTEGVVAHFFWRLATDDFLRRSYRDSGFYEQFGVSGDSVSPPDNVYLKVFAALFDGRPATAVDLAAAYGRLFGDEKPRMDVLVQETFGGPMEPVPELWLANTNLEIGTSLFDQFRALPRAHTFDANAATLLDWISVPEITVEHARLLVAGAPYGRLADLEHAAGPDAWARIRAMASAMQVSGERARDEEETLNLRRIVFGYLWRLAWLVTVASLSGALLIRRGVRGWPGAGFIACAATLLVIFWGWMVVGPWWLPVAAPPVFGGLPWAAGRLLRGRGGRAAALATGVWAAASVPALFLTNLSRWL